MSKKKKKISKAEKKAKVHEELKGFEIKINPLGEITSSYSIDQLNEFLDKNVYDKKLPDLGLEKPGTTSKDEDDKFHVEETPEEEETPDEILKKPSGKLKPTRKRKPSDDEDDDDADDEIDAEDDED
ncbi:MAG TPA: hypothetical protein VK927_02515 [Adhaeribacter sp.]|nr:hypothetical protein [Adhaeribacter sp.]